LWEGIWSNSPHESCASANGDPNDLCMSNLSYSDSCRVTAVSVLDVLMSCIFIHHNIQFLCRELHAQIFPTLLGKGSGHVMGMVYGIFQNNINVTLGGWAMAVNYCCSISVYRPLTLGSVTHYLTIQSHYERHCIMIIMSIESHYQDMFNWQYTEISLPDRLISLRKSTICEISGTKRVSGLWTHLPLLDKTLSMLNRSTFVFLEFFTYKQSSYSPHVSR
jgi:hypothetical protein